MTTSANKKLMINIFSVEWLLMYLAVHMREKCSGNDKNKVIVNSPNEATFWKFHGRDSFWGRGNLPSSVTKLIPPTLKT